MGAEVKGPEVMSPPKAYTAPRSQQREDSMSRTKAVSFVDAASIYFDTCSDQELRDHVAMAAIYARVRKLPFKVMITDVKPSAQDELKLIEAKS